MVEDHPDDGYSHYNLALVLKKQDRLQEAVIHFLKVVELKPDLSEAHFNLGDILWRQSKLDESASALRRAIDLRPDDATAILTLGTILREKGRTGGGHSLLSSSRESSTGVFRSPLFTRHGSPPTRSAQRSAPGAKDR